MTKEEKKAAILKAIADAGTSQAAIARHLEVVPATVSLVVCMKGRSSKVERELEKLCGFKIYDTPAAAQGRPKTTYDANTAKRVAA